jgi:3-hydroxybutyryl-CoA dehydrogenase
MAEKEISRVAVIGMGIMGPDIALGFALGGCQTAAYARRLESLDDARQRVVSNLEQLVKEGLLLAKEAETAGCLIEFTTDWDRAVSQAQYVTEVVPENPQIKREIFQRCGETCGEEAIIASNTSSISLDEIAGAMRQPGRAIVTHWFIPAHLMPVVEVIPGKVTTATTVQQTRTLLTRIGKRPVVCKENPAFVHNYIQAAMCHAAMTLLERGICEPEDIDAIVQNGFALRLARIGPVRMADYAGLDTSLALLKYVFQKTGDPSFEPPAILMEKVARGDLGLKSGRGFYAYSPEEAARIRRLADETVIRVRKALGDI